MRRWVIPVLMALLAVSFFVWLSWPQQSGDPTFDARVAQPAYTGGGPRVLFDEAHWNVHTTSGRYKPFADLLRNDGYVVVANQEPFTRESLAGYRVLVISNALGVRGVAQQVANFFRLEGKVDFGASAFGEDECLAARDWVRDGGALLLIADHAPAGQAAANLAAQFGVEMTTWYAEDPKQHDPETGNWGFLIFSRENGLLADHPITRGRNPSAPLRSAGLGAGRAGDAERVNRVITFTGQTLKGPPGSVPFLQLSAEAIEYPRRRSADNEFRRVPNAAQGLALEFGKGRVVVLGEAAMLTSQVARASGRELRFGMSRPGYNNRQLALNVLHWLSRAF